jgi:hypothetical protein
MVTSYCLAKPCDKVAATRSPPPELSELIIRAIFSIAIVAFIISFVRIGEHLAFSEFSFHCSVVCSVYVKTEMTASFNV